MSELNGKIAEPGDFIELSSSSHSDEEPNDGPAFFSDLDSYFINYTEVFMLASILIYSLFLYN